MQNRAIPQELGQFDIIKATFNPVVTDDIDSNWKAIIGKTGLWQIMFVNDPEYNKNYAGQWQCEPIRREEAKIVNVNPEDCLEEKLYSHCPEEDLDFITFVTHD